MEIFDNLAYEAEIDRIKDLRKRKGVLVVSKQLMDSMKLDELKLLFGNFYPINAEVIRFGDEIRYFGFSEHFSESIEGESIEYIATIRRPYPKGEITISFEKV